MGIYNRVFCSECWCAMEWVPCQECDANASDCPICRGNYGWWICPKCRGDRPDNPPRGYQLPVEAEMAEEARCISP